MEDHPPWRVLCEGRGRVHMHRLRVLNGAVVCGGLELSCVVEVAGEHGFAQRVPYFPLRLCVKVHLGALAELDKLVVDVARTLHGANLDEIVVAPLRGVVGLHPRLVDVEHGGVVASRPVESDACVIRVHSSVLGPVEDGVADGEHGAHAQHLASDAHLACGKQGLGHLRVEGELGHLPAELGELALVVECAQGVELFEGADERLSGGGVHEVEVEEVVDTEALEEKDHVPQVGALDLGDHIVLELVRVGPLGVEAEAFARSHAP
mmetsp:Transcript_29417/g.79078  ORF Transcript_29417/g.79078 Transcript_29417/m.79078 type:complete len:265 (-) Transcript_29417:919-1713(-)